MAKAKAITCNQLLFLNEYLANGRVGRQAWLTLHPHAKQNSADTQASRMLNSVEVQAEIAKRMRIEGGVTRESINAWLNDIAERAKKSDRPDVELKAVIELADLAGFKVRKIEDVTPKEGVDRTNILSELRQRGLVPSN